MYTDDFLSALAALRETFCALVNRRAITTMAPVSGQFLLDAIYLQATE